MELIQLAVPVLLKGLWVTAALTLVSVLIGFNLGLGLALMRLSSNAFSAGFAKYYSNVFRGTPLLVQIFIFYYGLGEVSLVRNNPVLWWVISDGSRCAVLALALNTAAYTSEILRGGLMSVPAGLVEAAQACGMSRVLRFRRIEFPLAIRQALPAYGNELILVVKGTSLASTITVLEITGYAKRLMSQTFAIFEIFAIAGILYLVINLLLITITRSIERWLMRHESQSRHELNAPRSEEAAAVSRGPS
ncbi:ABC transporter permease [Mesorhizobium sp. 113-1-2]|jgi:octopine/nopaline transport system permease protein|uniref:ABC transporter permease n=1 Tax=Mesorhizobium sp. 113-1-2 TaxID=2744515 RepID=UPI0008197C01|nr:ABC transporter permease [Mesorhizobium sp. 113-1-2]BAV51131.1 polar amino acid ABC transporter inner membrane subunit [Mesorhizobium loti]BCG75192.1 ABC transporter permease [Mesorhizobium sp. 113-1-2]